MGAIVLTGGGAGGQVAGGHCRRSRRRSTGLQSPGADATDHGCLGGREEAVISVPSKGMSAVDFPFFTTRHPMGVASEGLLATLGSQGRFSLKSPIAWIEECSHEGPEDP